MTSFEAGKISVRRLSEEDRQLIGRVVQARGRKSDGERAAETGAASKTADRSALLDFKTLPGFAEQNMLRSAAAAMGLRDPYFLVHEGDAGAETVIDGRRMANFSSYDYLGFNHHPAVRAAAKAAIDHYGVSPSASRLVAGERPIHRALESALADHYRQEACLTYVSGHAANVATIGALLGPRDLILHDALAHNSIVMGGLLSQAERRAFAHNDIAGLDAILTEIRGQYERVLIVAEGLYSMDGDVCDLPTLAALKERHQAWLMIDDAHGLGTLGARGRGVFEHFDMDPRGVDIWMGTLSKTLAGCGGYIAGPAALIEYLKRTAGGFVYSVAMPPTIAAAALKALELLHSEPERVSRLRANGAAFVEKARAAGLDTGASIGASVVPIMTGSSVRAVALSQRLFDRGVNVQPIIYPAIPERLARLRFFLSSEHRLDQIDSVIPVIAAELEAANSVSLTSMARGAAAS